MTETPQTQETTQPAENTEPRSNPEPDEAAVEQSKEKLEEVSGN